MITQTAHQLLESAIFVFAKSMPNSPHCYTIKENWPDVDKFEQVVQFIRDNGVLENWYKHKYVYYYLNGFKYWTMGNPINQTRLINRAAL